MFFWAWEDHKNRMEMARNKARNEGRNEGRNEAAKEYEAKLALAAKEREDVLAAARERAKTEGIDIDRFLNP